MKRELYIYEILRSLDRHKGSAQLNPTVYDEVFEALRGGFSGEDFALVPSGSDTRWKNHIRQTSRDMIEYGLIKRRIHNTWDITDEGRIYLKAYPNVTISNGVMSWLSSDEW